MGRIDWKRENRRANLMLDADEQYERDTDPVAHETEEARDAMDRAISSAPSSSTPAAPETDRATLESSARAAIAKAVQP